MTTWTINPDTAACSRYTNYDFLGFCQAENGNYYGLTATGLYLLSGDDDAGSEIASFVDFGRLDFGTPALKHITNAYAGTESGEKLKLYLGSYGYEARSYDADDYKLHRFDVGRGLRYNYYEPRLTNTHGGNFTLVSFEIAAVPTTRRI